MNRLAHWMMRLYPSRWRRRYGDELNALLADTGADARVVTDLFRGGMRMQFKTWPFPKLAVALGILGALLGTGYSFLLPSEYTSEATVQISPGPGSDKVIDSNVAMNERIQEIEASILSRPQLAAIIDNPRLLLYADQLNAKSIEDIIEEIKRNIRILFVQSRGKSAFEVRFTYPDRLKAQQTVAALVEAFRAVEEQREASVARAIPGRKYGTLQVVQSANQPTAPLYPERPLAALAGFVAGLFLAAILRLFWRTGLIARRFALGSVAFGIVGLLAVIVADSLDALPYRYRSVATLRLDGGNAAQVSALTADVLNRTSISRVINDLCLQLHGNLFPAMPLEDMIDAMKRNLAIGIAGNQDGPVFSVSFVYPDRYKARMVVQAIMNRFDESDARLFPALPRPERLAPVVLDILHAPSMPVVPSRPDRRVIAAMGGGIGLIIAAIVATIRHRWKPEPDFPLDAVQDQTI